MGLALEVRDACLSLAGTASSGWCATSPVLEATVGGFLIWFTAWSHDVTELDVWRPALGGAKLMDLTRAGDEFEVRSFKRAGEWTPALLALAREESRMLMC